MKVHQYNFNDVDKHIEDVRKKGETLKQKIHALGVAILLHWYKNPQDALVVAEKMNALQGASPYHANAFSQWVALTGMEWSKETERWFLHKDQKISLDTFKECRDKPFWEVSPPHKVNPYIMADRLQAILDAARKRQKNPKDGDKISPKAMRLLVDAIAACNEEEQE